MSEAMKFPGQLVFGLDIGTRSIVGTVGYRVGDKFHVVSQSIREHGTRSMLDGQIHDIYKVGGTIGEVKAELDHTLRRNCRFLQFHLTIVRFDRNYDRKPHTDHKDDRQDNLRISYEPVPQRIKLRL